MRTETITAGKVIVLLPLDIEEAKQAWERAKKVVEAYLSSFETTTFVVEDPNQEIM